MADLGHGVRVPGSACAACGKVLDVAASVTGQREAPRHGDLSICAYCHAVNVFQDDGTLRAATEAEAWAAIDLIEMMRARAQRN